MVSSPFCALSVAKGMVITMIDKFGIKIDPKQAISIQIGDTLPDILPLLQRGLTGHENPENRPETIRKICLSISICVSGEKELPPCR